MSAESAEKVIRELVQSVNTMRDKIVSLEKLLFDQNKLLNVLVGNSAVLKFTQTGPEEGRSAVKSKLTTAPATTSQRSVRDARSRAEANIAATGRKGGAGRSVPSLSIPTAGSSASRSAPPTPTAPMLSPALAPTPQINNMTHQKLPTTMNVNKPGDQSADVQGFTEVINRKSRKAPTNIIRGTGQSSLSSIVAAERKSYLHLYYVQLGTTSEQVIAYLDTICPGRKCSAEALKSRGDYASFKLSVPTKDVDKYLSPEHWAEDVHIKPWRSGFRKPQQ